jgi:hypothetical protein
MLVLKTMTAAASRIDLIILFPYLNLNAGGTAAVTFLLTGVVSHRL